MVNYFHKVKTSTANPQVIIYKMTDNDDNGSHIVTGTIGDVRNFMETRVGMNDDDEMTIKLLQDDKTMFGYIEHWGYSLDVVCKVTLKDFENK